MSRGARSVPVPTRAVRMAAALSWRAHLQPSPPGWLDMALAAHHEHASSQTRVGLSPKFTSEEALLELIDGIRRGDGLATPPLDPAAGGPLRFRELATGVGGAQRSTADGRLQG